MGLLYKLRKMIKLWSNLYYKDSEAFPNVDERKAFAEKNRNI